MLIKMIIYEDTDAAYASIWQLQSLRSFKLAVSLGGVASLVEHPASMSHGPVCMNNEDRKEAHVDPALIRLRY